MPDPPTTSFFSSLCSTLRPHHILTIPLAAMGAYAVYEQYLAVSRSRALDDLRARQERKHKRHRRRQRRRRTQDSSDVVVKEEGEAAVDGKGTTTRSDSSTTLSDEIVVPSASSPHAGETSTEDSVVTDESVEASMVLVSRKSVICDSEDSEDETSSDNEEDEDLVAKMWSPGPWRHERYASQLLHGRFINPFESWEERSLFSFLQWIATRKCRNGVPVDPDVLEREHPLRKVDFDAIRRFERVHGRRVDEEGKEWMADAEDEDDDDAVTQISPLKEDVKDAAMTVTWLGQSTCYVQLPGLAILTDPVFSERTVNSWVGPRRLRPTPCRVTDLPRVDIVLVSHSHFDHLDVEAVKEIGNSAIWLIPLGLRQWFVRRGVSNVREMDWWQEVEFREGVKVVCVPTQHWSGRGLLDQNKSLWCGFIVQSMFSSSSSSLNNEPVSFLHCGDTGYCPAFPLIGEKYGPITLAALPIGSYAPEWYMAPHHISPREAVQIHLDVKAKTSIGVHWGTFLMSDEGWKEPAGEFVKAAREMLEDGEGRCMTTYLGETCLVKRDGGVVRQPVV